MNDQQQIIQFHTNGLVCSQTIMALGLRLMGRKNNELILALRGAVTTRHEATCGGLVGASGILSLYASHRLHEEDVDQHLQLMIDQLHEWFHTEGVKWISNCQYGNFYQGESVNPSIPCPLITEIFHQTKLILIENEYDLCDCFCPFDSAWVPFPPAHAPVLRHGF